MLIIIHVKMWTDQHSRPTNVECDTIATFSNGRIYYSTNLGAFQVNTGTGLINNCSF